MNTQLGTTDAPLRVVVVGAGPAGFFAAAALIKNERAVVVDLFEAIPSPYGLVRFGVAPDHPQLKKVIATFDKTAANDAFHYFGNVRLGTDISLEELKRFYDAVIISVGTPRLRKLGIPGEDLANCHGADEFINWYNGYPGYEDRRFNLDCETAMVIGNGNVALDAARMLCRTAGELSTTDTTDFAQRALAGSKIKTVYVVGRRGPVQASFTHPEILELEKMGNCDIVVDPRDLVIEEVDKKELDEDDSRIQARRFWPFLEKFSSSDPGEKNQKMIFKFLCSPVALEGDGKIERVVLEKNLLNGEPGSRKAVGTGETETVDCGLLIRCVGYKGIPVEDIPFDEARGVVPNDAGRVLEDGNVVPGLYVSGWAKRGPSGVIGTNKPDSNETVKSLLADIDTLTPCEQRDSDELAAYLNGRGVQVVDFEDWKKIDAEEVLRGARDQKPREKIVKVQEMLDVLKGD